MGVLDDAKRRCKMENRGVPRREGHARVLPFPFLLICPGRSGGSSVIDPQTFDGPCSAESTQDFTIFLNRLPRFTMRHLFVLLSPLMANDSFGARRKNRGNAPARSLAGLRGNG